MAQWAASASPHLPWNSSLLSPTPSPAASTFGQQQWGAAAATAASSRHALTGAPPPLVLTSPAAAAAMPATPPPSSAAAMATATAASSSAVAVGYASSKAGRSRQHTRGRKRRSADTPPESDALLSDHLKKVRISLCPAQLRLQQDKKECQALVYAGQLQFTIRGRLGVILTIQPTNVQPVTVFLAVPQRYPNEPPVLYQCLPGTESPDKRVKLPILTSQLWRPVFGIRDIASVIAGHMLKAKGIDFNDTAFKPSMMLRGIADQLEAAESAKTEQLLLEATRREEAAAATEEDTAMDDSSAAVAAGTATAVTLATTSGGASGGAGAGAGAGAESQLLLLSATQQQPPPRGSQQQQERHVVRMPGSDALSISSSNSSGSNDYLSGGIHAAGLSIARPEPVMPLLAGGQSAQLRGV